MQLAIYDAGGPTYVLKHDVLCAFATPRVVKDDEVEAYMTYS